MDEFVRSLGEKNSNYVLMRYKSTFSKGELILTMFVSNQSTVVIDVVDQFDKNELNDCNLCFMRKKRRLLHAAKVVVDGYCRKSVQNTETCVVDCLFIRTSWYQCPISYNTEEYFIKCLKRRPFMELPT